MANKSRYFIMTAHIENMKKTGLSNEQINDAKYVAKFFLDAWKNSAPSRTGCISVCVSSTGVYHLHGALLGESTTVAAVAKVMFDSHIEICKGGKTKLMKYILKEDEYAEKGEQVIYAEGKENIQIKKGHRTDLEDIELLIQQGYTPREIMEEKFSYRRYEKQIKGAYADKKLKEAPVRKSMYRVWHVGESGTGKSYTYDRLCAANDKEDIYFAGYMTNGWADSYMEAGAPSILFLDELKSSGSWQELLNVLDVYSTRPIHCRYTDIYPLWTQVHITSIYPPEDIYKQMVKEEYRNNDSLKQLLRRLDEIVYHYIDNGKYMEYRIPASQYTNYDDLKKAAHSTAVITE